MEGKEFQWQSQFLNHEMKLRVYGDAGKPILAFPTECGHHYDLENFGMVDIAKDYIEAGKIQMITLDSYDKQSWLDDEMEPAERAVEYDNYVRYIMREVVPFVQKQCTIPEDDPKLGVLGISLGGYHACNMFFRFPEVFNLVMSLSGKLHLEQYIGSYMDETVYFNSPMHYLKNLTDETYLQQYRESQIIICVGHGQWEDEMIEDAMELQMLLRKKKVRTWLDFWGYDVDHDWAWWRREWEYFLDQLFHLESRD